MAFFKDWWKNTTNPDEPSDFASSYAAQLLQGGGNTSRAGRLAAKLAGGLMAGGQRAGAANQKKSRAEEMKGIFGPMFASGPGNLLKSGAPQLLQGGAKGILSPEGLMPAPSGAVATGGPAAAAAAEAAMTPEALAAVTQGSGSLPGLSESQRAAGQFGVQMAMSDSPEMKAMGMSLIQGAMKTPERFKTVGNNIFDTMTNTYLVPPEKAFDIKLAPGERAIRVETDPRTGKRTERVFTGPEKRERPTVLRDINDPTTGQPSAFLLNEEGTGLGARLGTEAPNVSTVNTRDLTRGTETDLQRELVLAENSLAKLNEIDSMTKRQYLTGSGKLGLWGKEKFNNFISSVSGNPSVFEKELTRFEDWNTMSMAYVNDTIKNYTGVAMPPDEAPRLLAGMPDPKDSPAAHAGAMRASKRMAEISVKLTRQYLNEGLPLDDAKKRTASTLGVAIEGFSNKNYGAANRALDRAEGRATGGIPPVAAGGKYDFTEVTE